MRKASLLINTWRWLLAFALVMGLAAAQTAGASAQEGLRWTLDLAPGLIQEAGIQARVESLRASADPALISGSGPQEALRALLFDDLAPLSLTTQKSELRLTVPALSRLELRLEARLSTGYRWDSTGTSIVRVQEAALATPRAAGRGMPAIQTFSLENPFNVDQVVSFIYARPFEPETATELHLDLEGLRGSPVLELTDPSFVHFPTASLPTAPLATEPQVLLPAIAYPLPSSYDSRNYGWVSPVRNQRSCGACWAFGTVGAMEVALARSGLGIQDLSEQFLVSCNASFDKESGAVIRSWGCKGGLTAHMFHYDTKDLLGQLPGSVAETTMPYAARDLNCIPLQRTGQKLADWGYVAGGKDMRLEGFTPDVASIKAAIFKYGSVTAGVCADEPTCLDAPSEIDTDHQILIVGWDDADRTWIVKNSYGVFWGDKGYYRVRWNTAAVGEGASWVRMVSTSPIEPVPMRPEGATLKTNYTLFTWLGAKGGGPYELELDGKTLLITDEKLDCSDGVCRVAISLKDNKAGDYVWRVRRTAGAFTSPVKLSLLDVTDEQFMPILSKP